MKSIAWPYKMFAMENEMTRNFHERATRFQGLSQSLASRYNRLATTRIILFVLFLVTCVWMANAGMGYPLGISILLFPIAFGLIIRYHNRVRFERDQQRFLSLVNQEEIARLKGDLQGLNPGTGYSDPLHPYSDDLDVFGKNSLYQLLNRTSTPSGADTLAQWLKEPASQQQIIHRQKAVLELKEMLDWRKDFQALGRHDHDEKQDVGSLKEWLKEPTQLIHKPAYKFLAWVLPMVTVSLIVLNATQVLSIYFTLGLLVVNGLVLRNVQEYVKKITEDTSANVGLLKAYSRLIEKIEDTSFKNSHLAHLQEAFKHTGFSAAASILRLQKILDFLNSRANMFYALIDVLFLTDLHLVIAAENWKKKNEHDVSVWFDRIGEFEALNSLAAFAYANPGYAFPTLSGKPYHFYAKTMGHPLIHATGRVCNDFQMEGRGSIAVITGSNMSGKSTFLRTIGINAVIALCGAPTCTTEMSISVLQVFTGMRTQDNLEEHVSSFYAELKRIKQLLETVQEERIPVLYMLDEILKGTNSKDRHLGSVSLIKQLSNTPSFGLISTHDLELGNRAKDMESVSNYSFNSSIEGDEILFDYALTHDICHSFNASKLMEKMGIRITEDEV